MSGKSKIKHEVFRPHFAQAVRAVAKLAGDGKNQFIPKTEKRDRGGTIANARFCIEDTGVRMHGFNNVHRAGNNGGGDDDDDDENGEPDEDFVPGATTQQQQSAPTGYVVENLYGTALLTYVLSPVRKAFAAHERIETFIMVMDKGIFNPRPKTYIQVNRTKQMEKTMEKQQVLPITYKPGEVPEIIAADKIIPPWIAVKADRTLYYHAVSQMFDMMFALYRPPPGRRVIVDCLDMAATAPNSLGEWMHSERLVLDQYAQKIVAETRELLRDNPDWWTKCRHIGYELAHGGHIASVPVCIETAEDGTTYQPFLLYNALCHAGEADIEMHNWMTKMSAPDQHITLAGDRKVSAPVDDRNLEFYDAQQIRDMQEAAEQRGAQPLPLSEQPEKMQAPGDETQNNCTHPNRGLILTCDTDFLSITLLWYARFCFLNRRTGLNCLDNAPLFSIGECEVLRTGWLQSGADYYVKPKAALKRKRPEAPTTAAPAEEGQPIVAIEVYDVHRLWQMVAQCDVASNSTLKHLERVASFVAFCVMCGNDYLAGLYFVSRKNMYAAYKALAENPAIPTLVRFDDADTLTAIINPAVYTHFIKGCYYQQLMSMPGAANKPVLPVHSMSYHGVNEIVRAKWKDRKKHMPDDETLLLMYERATWAVNYALHGPQSITHLLDDSIWGWKSGTIDKRV